MSESGSLCKWCLKILFLIGLLGIAVLVLWLTDRPIKPRYYLISFNLLPSPPGDPIASYQLEIENKNGDMGVHHDAITLSLSSYAGNLTVSSSVVTPFYQGHKKTAEKTGTFTGGDRNGSGLKNETAKFRVGLESAYWYEVMWWTRRRYWETRRHEVSLSCDAEVGVDGKKTAEKGIRFASAAAPAIRLVVPAVGFILFVIFSS